MAPRSATTLAIAASDPTILCSVWKPIPPFSGTVSFAPGNAGTWAGSIELLDTCFANVPPEIRELRVRADAGFGYDPIFDGLEGLGAEYAVVARLTPGFRSLLPGLRYEAVNREWEMAECEHRSHGW